MYSIVWGENMKKYQITKDFHNFLRNITLGTGFIPMTSVSGKKYFENLCKIYGVGRVFYATFVYSTTST